MLFYRRKNNYKIERVVQVHQYRKMKYVQIVDYKNLPHNNNFIVHHQQLRKINIKKP